MVPEIDYRPPISDLFANFWYNWETIFPAVAIVVGIGFATFIIKKIKGLY